MNDIVDRIRKVNRKAYFQFKSRAEFMCLDTSTWKDPEMTDIDKIVQDLKDTQWKMADEIEKLRTALKTEREILDKLLDGCNASRSIPKPGPCGMTIDAQIRHSWIKLSGHYVQDAREATYENREIIDV